MRSYVAVSETENDEAVEIPIEDDGTLLLSTLDAHFPGACGLKYRQVGAQAVRGVKRAEGVFHPPEEGWSYTFFCVFPKTGEKRRYDDDLSNSAKLRKLTEKERCTDLIVLGLPWKTTEKELKEYFEQFGEVVLAQVKSDWDTGRSKGFGFVRFADFAVQKRVLATRRHKIDGRFCDVKVSGFKDESDQILSGRLFISRCSSDIEPDDLANYFGEFGEVIDVFVPKPCRGFAFVTFMDPDVAQSICDEDHIIKGNSVHVSNAAPRSEFARRGRGQGRPGRGGFGRGGFNRGQSGEGDGWSQGGGYRSSGSQSGSANGGAGGGGDSNMNPLNMLAALSQASMGLFENLRQQMQDGSGTSGGQYGSKGSDGQYQSGGGGSGNWGSSRAQDSWGGGQSSSWRGRGRSSNEEYCR